MTSSDIILAVPSGPGWAPIHEMARLMASYLDARIVTPDPSASLKPATKILARVPRIRGKGRTAIVIASDPGQLYAIAQPRLVARRYAEIYGWVIDSFWDDRIPAIATNSTYNTVFVADRDDVHDWRSVGVKTCECSPGAQTCGADLKSIWRIQKPLICFGWGANQPPMKTMNAPQNVPGRRE